MMRAITIAKPGGPEVLQFSELPIPTPGIEQILVKVHATALNRADISQRRGTYPPPADHSPILGLEMAGEVIAVGEEVSGFNVGDRIFGLLDGGGYAEYCLIDAHMALPMPGQWSYEEAAAIPEVFLTAQTCLFQLGDLKSGESILIHAGGSGVGTAAIQMARQIGATVYVTAGSLAKIDRAIKLGAHAGIDYHTQDFVDVIKELTHDAGVDVIIDSIGGDYFAKNLNCLKTDGRLIQIAKMSGENGVIRLGLVIMKRLQIKGSTMRSRPLAEKRAITQRFREQWLPLLINGSIKPVIDMIFPFEQVQDAHEYLETNQSFGKVILSFDLPSDVRHYPPAS